MSDESTSEIMIHFYEGLKQGNSKDVALQKAKLSYLENQEVALKSHPYFWAGFVLKGNSEAISLNKTSFVYWLLAFGLLITMGAFWRFRHRNRDLQNT